MKNSGEVLVLLRSLFKEIIQNFREILLVSVAVGVATFILTDNFIHRPIRLMQRSQLDRA